MNRLSRVLLCAWVLAAGLAFSSWSYADLLSGSTFVQCSADGNSGFHATDCSIGGFPGVPSSAIGSAALSPYPYARAEATRPANGFVGAGVSAQAFYYFQVVGGTVGDLVPLLVELRVSAQGTAEAFSLAKVIIRTTAMALPDVTEVCSDGSCDDTSIFETVPITAFSGAPFDSIQLYAEARAQIVSSSTETAFAIADPYIYVDPAFAGANLYSIAVSPGAGNIPVVPEPATWALFAAGVLALGLRSVRRTR